MSFEKNNKKMLHTIGMMERAIKHNSVLFDIALTALEKVALSDVGKSGDIARIALTEMKKCNGNMLLKKNGDGII